MKLWLAIFSGGALLRWLWVFSAYPWGSIEDFRDNFIYSDMFQYWSSAENLWNPTYVWGVYDTLFPPGTSYLFALILGPDMDRLFLFHIIQWLMSVAILALTGLLALQLFGRRAGLVSLALAAVAFPLFDYAGYALAETPFTLLLLSAVLLFIRGYEKKSWVLFLMSGLLFGLSATLKSVGLIAAVFLCLAFLHPLFRRPLRRTGVCLCALLCGLILILAPTSMVMTQRNDGNFLLLSNDIFRLALANHDHLLSAHFQQPDIGEYIITSPVSTEKGFTDVREIPWDRDLVIRENMAWVQEHPGKAAIQTLERMGDLIIGTIPFPTNGTSFRPLAAASQFFMLIVIYIPVCLLLLRARRMTSSRERAFLWILLLPVCGIFATALIAATEPRYLHPFAPMLIVAASVWYARLWNNQPSTMQDGGA